MSESLPPPPPDEVVRREHELTHWAQQQESKDSEHPPLKVIGIAAAVLVGLGVIGALNSDGDDDDSGSECQAVTYHIEGTAQTVDITMQNSSGDTEQFAATLPVRLPMGCMDGDFAYISAQNRGETGTVECRITRGLNPPVVVAQASSSGAFKIATCSD